MTSLQERKQALIQLGHDLREDSEGLRKAIHEAGQKNPWFTVDNIRKALYGITSRYLDKDMLDKWLARYSIKEVGEPKNVAAILAGNIPLVGIHDILAIFICGHHASIKMSGKDDVLLPYILSLLTSRDDRFRSSFAFVDRLVDYDAVIATGSDTSARYFRQYFGHVPHIIRNNRNGVAVIERDTSDEELRQLGDDIFSFFGLGCRNVSKIFVEQGFRLERIFDAMEPYGQIIHHNKYKNNYDYNHAVWLLNDEEFLTNNVLLLKKDETLSSRIASVHYEFFEDRNELERILLSQKDAIQCVVSSEPVEGFPHVDFGQSQLPAPWDYADDIDTLEFLINL